jgi:uncharacterized membrane protein SpoIIM required for sporulation
VFNYCPNCGAPLGVEQNFCRNCGFDIRERVQREQVQLQPSTPGVRGLARNSVVYLTQEGLLGVEIQSDALLFLTFLVPLPLLGVIYYITQTGALAVYATLWLAVSLLLYDELRWRGLRRFNANPPAARPNGQSWLVPWQSIRMADWNGRTLWFTAASPSKRLSVTFDPEDAPAVERATASYGVRYAWRPPRFPTFLTRLSTFALLLFIIGQIILILAATLPFFPGEEQLYTTIVNNTRSSVLGATFFGEFRAIFLNNIQVALGGALPFLGTLSFGIASYNTGRALQAIAINDGAPPSLLLVLLYLFPHTWIEESAYPIATASGLLAVTKWRSVSPTEFLRRLNWGSTKFALALGGVALILMTAGFFEVLANYLGFGVIALWAPLGILYYLFAVRYRKHKRAQPPRR